MLGEVLVWDIADEPEPAERKGPSESTGDGVTGYLEENALRKWRRIEREA
jgi:hypothetical protein